MSALKKSKQWFHTKFKDKWKFQTGTTCLTILNLSDEVVCMICMHLSACQLGRLGQTCSKLYCLSSTQSLWKHFCQRDFGLQLDSLPDGVSCFQELYEIISHVHMIRDFDFHWDRWETQADIIATLTLDRDLPKRPSLHSCNYIPNITTFFLWQFNEEDLEHYEGPIKELRYGCHFFYRPKHYKWENLHDLAMKFYGKKQWQQKMLTRQIKAKEALLRACYDKEAGVVYQLRRARFHAWRLAESSHSAVNSNLVSALHYGFSTDSGALYGHKFLQNMYMNGELFAGLETVKNYARFCHELRKFINTYPMARTHKSEALTVYKDSIDFMCAHLKHDLYIDLVHTERMVRVGKICVKRSMDLANLTVHNPALWRPLQSQDCYRNYLESANEEFLQQAKAYLKWKR